MTHAARTERQLLCDLFTEVGPDAPTLCGDWTTRDLAAHLVVRDRRPDSMPGLVFGWAAGHTERVRLGAAEKDWSELVDLVRTGPPVWSPTRLGPIDALVNSLEFFVHHEDVRRGGANGADVEIRWFDPEKAYTLWKGLKRAAKALARSAPSGLVIASEGHTPVTVKAGDDPVTITGPVGELVLYLYGRQAVSHVEAAGDPIAIERMHTAPLGI